MPLHASSLEGPLLVEEFSLAASSLNTGMEWQLGPEMVPKSRLRSMDVEQLAVLI